MNAENIALGYLGRLSEACAGGEDLIALARSAGMSGVAHDRAIWLAFTLMDSGQVDRGMSLAQATHDEALAAGLLVTAADCGDPIVTGLTWQGRFDEAETLLEELRDLGLGEGRWRRVRGLLSLARGDVESATVVMPQTSTKSQHPAVVTPTRATSSGSSRSPPCGEDHDRCLEVARSYLGLLDDCDSPLSSRPPRPDRLPGAGHRRHRILTRRLRRSASQATRQLQRARAQLTDEWRAATAGVQLALAEGYAARVAGQPGVEQFREAAALAEPFGAFFALEPRLDLAQELLAHGGRDEGRELLVDCWTAAHDMGARGLEQRAFRLATRTRVPAPGVGGERRDR